jgi:uncharacterized protein YcbX
MHVSEVNIYPVKSLKGISLQSAIVEDRGFQFDRRWMLVDKDDRFITQREVPRMATVTISVDGNGMKAVRNGSSIDVPLEAATGDTANVTIWGDTVTAEFYPQEIHKWFTDAIGSECRLVGLPVTTKRLLPDEFAIRKGEDDVSFADGYPYLLIGEGSLADLNSRLPDPVPMNSFRPNLVVAGSEPFEEDTWKRVRIGPTEFHVVKPSARCVLTTVDQVHGEKTGKEPLATLSEYRNRDGKVLFGQNLIADNPGGTVRVGDTVEILETR